MDRAETAYPAKIVQGTATGEEQTKRKKKKETQGRKVSFYFGKKRKCTRSLKGRSPRDDIIFFALMFSKMFDACIYFYSHEKP